MILCDIGNTTFHFFIDGKHQKYFLKEDLPKFDDEIFYICVNKLAEQKLLKSNPNARNIKDMIKFDTKYKGMGIDRQLASCFATNEVIVDAGSAITVDIVENGVHQGGFILLGVYAFMNAYENISPVLKVDFEKNINLDKIPLQTKEAINHAILKSIILPIKEVSKDKKIVFTGGDGEFLSKYFKNSIYKENLIFENMKKIIENKGK